MLRFGDEWISDLTEREWWLIENYRSAPTEPLTYPSDSFAGLEARRAPAALQDEVDRAHDRAEWMEAQRAEIDFLLAPLFAEGVQAVDRHAFEQRLSRIRSLLDTYRGTAPTLKLKKDRGAPALAQERADKILRAELKSEKITPAVLEEMKHEALAELCNCSRGPALEARRIILDEIAKKSIVDNSNSQQEID
jgi:hypothetical protein